MKINAIIFLITVLSFFTIRASQELEQMITKTDIEGVKKVLPAVKFDFETKTRLIDLANDIILMRLKNVEIYSFKDITADDFNILKESLSRQTIEGADKDGVIWRRWNTIRKIALVCAVAGVCTAFGSLAAIPKYEAEGRKFFVLFFGGLGLFKMAIIGACYSLNKMGDAIFAILSKIRSNLQQNYYDSIVIKRLIINAACLT